MANGTIEIKKKTLLDSFMLKISLQPEKWKLKVDTPTWIVNYVAEQNRRVQICANKKVWKEGLVEQNERG